jgi:hypothetical protein
MASPWVVDAGQLQLYRTRNGGEPTRGGPPAGALGCGAITPRWGWGGGGRLEYFEIISGMDEFTETENGHKFCNLEY